MKSAAKLIRRFVSILLLSAVLLVIINVAVYAVLVSEKAPTETTSPYDIAEKAGEAFQVLPDGTYCLSEEVSSELEEKIYGRFLSAMIPCRPNGKVIMYPR